MLISFNLSICDRKMDGSFREHVETVICAVALVKDHLVVGEFCLRDLVKQLADKLFRETLERFCKSEVE